MPLLEVTEFELLHAISERKKRDINKKERNLIVFMVEIYLSDSYENMFSHLQWFNNRNLIRFQMIDNLSKSFNRIHYKDITKQNKEFT